MIRKSALVLGLITTFVGVWVLTRGHAEESACNSYANAVGRATIDAGCARAVSAYLMGAALTMGGLIVVVLLLFAIARQVRTRGWRERLPQIARRHERSVSSVPH